MADVERERFQEVLLRHTFSERAFVITRLVALITLRHELFVEDAFMGGMLVNQVKTLWPFGNDVKRAHLAYDTQRGKLGGMGRDDRLARRSLRRGGRW